MPGACSLLPWKRNFTGSGADTSNVFIIAVVVFALSFIVAGRLQDKLGPFKISHGIGGILVSMGFFLCCITHSMNQVFHVSLA